MSPSTQIKVYGKTYQIKTGSTAVDAQELAEYVDSKMQELTKGAGKTSTLDLAVLTALNIAQELFEARQESATREKATAARLETLARQVESALA